MAGRILVVDGVPTNRITMKVRLSSACYEVAAAASGTEALRLADLLQPQVVLIGASLPDMTAPELCAALRAGPGGSELPVLVQAQGVERIAALRAGASALIEAMGDDLTLLARIRGLMRADPQLEHAHGMAEPGAAFQHDNRPRAVFVADQPATALGWRHALQGRVHFAISVCDPERALSDAARGRVPDLYLIAADIHQPGDGLRLLSELRSRPLSRDAGFVIVLRAERAEMTAVALDLGAGDVLPADLTGPAAATEAAIRLETQLARKHDADRRREETQRNVALALTDPLTGLHNRRYALPRLAELFQQTGSIGGTLAVMLLDLDRFKQVNDNHGHAAGDAVLAAVARRLADSLPPAAFLARIGGEEFLAVLPDCPARAARLIAEDMRQAVQARPVPLPPECAEPELSVTISAGIAVIGDRREAAMLDPEMLLARADRALLSAKSAGRNRIVMAPATLAA
ncbi:diguanylate cyclase [Paracoccus limosus]|uniref:diguanylate cyclase n=1 Tax=Paracoccus limosus TaxID=913252 RepID=A0A844GZ51_9RHOB|nr:diguanylate cyclase [Paracoccus limosus]MTH33946.1 diguanylate cyclase [Paracoccus limosus]